LTRPGAEALDACPGRPTIRSMGKWLLVIAMVLAATSAVADQCPAPRDRAAEKAELLRELRTARNEASAQVVTQSLWRIWMDAPDARAQELLDRGLGLLRRADYGRARAVLGELVEYCPAYAEGWNQRAFAAYLSGDYAAALTDLDRALTLDPHHVPALSGKGLTLIELGQNDAGQVALRDAVRLNPWLRERALLTIPLGTEL
jgi:tetratricopeptide (TPR) repeat protein